LHIPTLLPTIYKERGLDEVYKTNMMWDVEGFSLKMPRAVTTGSVGGLGRVFGKFKLSSPDMQSILTFNSPHFPSVRQEPDIHHIRERSHNVDAH
jgi:hypothetical protein